MIERERELQKEETVSVVDNMLIDQVVVAAERGQQRKEEGSSREKVPDVVRVVEVPEITAGVHLSALHCRTTRLIRSQDREIVVACSEKEEKTQQKHNIKKPHRVQRSEKRLPLLCTFISGLIIIIVELHEPVIKDENQCIKH